MSNKQLTDKQYLESLNFKDTYYLSQLCQTVWEYIKNTPIPIYTSVFRKDDDVYIKFSIGKNNTFYKVDNDISFFDFVYRYKLIAQSFFPKYEYEEEVEIELSEEEIIEKTIKDNISLNDAVFLTKKVIVKNVGVIHKVHFLKDEFMLEHNGKKQMRMSGDINNVIPVKILLATVKEMISKEVNGKEIADYIFDNSVLLEEMSSKENDVTIDYSPAMMKTFFKLHYNELSNDPLEKLTSQVYRWNKYILNFQSDISEQECLKYYRKRKSQDN